MKDRELLDFYGSVFGSLQAAAEKDRKTIFELTENAENAILALRRTAKSFDHSYEKAVSQGIAEALKKTEGNLNAVSEAAKLAQTVYERAATRFTLKLTLMAVFVVISTAGTCWFTIRQAVPSNDQLLKLLHSSRSVSFCSSEGENLPCAFIIDRTTGKAQWEFLAAPQR